MAHRATPSGPRSTPFATERTAVAILAEWMNELIKEEKLEIGPADTEVTSFSKYPDLIIRRSSQERRKVICLIEAKRPPFPVDYDKDDARRKAQEVKAPYFCTTNFQELWWFDTKKVVENAEDIDQVVNRYTLSSITEVDDLRETSCATPTKRALREFLIQLDGLITRRAKKPKLSIDEFLVQSIRARVENLAQYYYRIIKDRFNADRKFAGELRRWFIQQTWSFRQDDEDFRAVARQTALLLVNKIVFYNALQAKVSELPALTIPLEDEDIELIDGRLGIFFKKVLQIDYETV